MEELFEKMADAVRPQKPVICDIEVDILNTGIEYRTWTTAPDLDEAVPGKYHYVRHEAFRQWLKVNDHLVWVHDRPNHRGEHEQTTGEIGYLDFLDQYLTTQIFYDYLRSTGLTSLRLEL